MGKSSKDKRDLYYRLAKEQGYRARSAYKLLQLNDQFDLFSGVSRVVDLCAAPGSWSQVLSRCLIQRPSQQQQQQNEKSQIQSQSQTQSQPPSQIELGQNGNSNTTTNVRPVTSKTPDVKIVALDLQPMTPLPGVITLQADITHPSTLPLVLTHLGSQDGHGNVDLVVSDGAPDVTGLHDLDEFIQGQLLLAALNLAACVLRKGGNFVAKIFRGRDVDELYSQLRLLFRRVTVAKPRSSRGSSIEAFVVCEFYDPPPGFEASLEKPISQGATIPSRPNEVGGDIESGVREVYLQDDHHRTDEEQEQEIHQPRDGRWIAPFLACGDLTDWDSDATYRIPDSQNGEKRSSLDPVQPPTAPPYKTALEMRRKLGSQAKSKAPNKPTESSTKHKQEEDTTQSLTGFNVANIGSN